MRRSSRRAGGVLAGVLALGCGLASANGLAGEQAASPAGGDKAAAEKVSVPLDGSALFHERGCEYCHGVAGIGTERGPSLLGVGGKLKTERISQQIHEGGGAMPAFGEVLTAPETDALIGYLQTLKKPAPAGRRKTQPAK